MIFIGSQAKNCQTTKVKLHHIKALYGTPEDVATTQSVSPVLSGVPSEKW